MTSQILTQPPYEVKFANIVLNCKSSRNSYIVYFVCSVVLQQQEQWRKNWCQQQKRRREEMLASASHKRIADSSSLDCSHTDWTLALTSLFNDGELMAKKLNTVI